MNPALADEIARHVWRTRYRLDERETSIEDTWQRAATALAAAEAPERRELWRRRFLNILQDFRFLPGGRILAGAGSGHRATLCNCFVMGQIEDSLEGIVEALKEGALTMQQGGGVGYDFSTLRPYGAPARDTGGIASGPVSFMRVWDALCATVLATHPRRGAMMATLRCDHPDIERFIAAKHRPGALSHFNLSVQVGEDFLAAVREGADWSLLFPDPDGGDGERLLRRWPGYADEVACRVHRRLPARALWRSLIEHAYAGAEPGVLFVDRINRDNNLGYCERIGATNPCGEIPLPPYGACVLGSINLTRFVLDPFGPAARWDLAGMARTAMVAVRLLDNALAVSQFPLPAQREQAHATRRIGLGVTGLADALIMLGLHYAAPEAREAAVQVLRCLRDYAYAASVDLARKKGAFPHLQREPYLAAPFVRRLPDARRAGIAEHGIRNSHLLAIAPAGSISLLAGNVSSGIEPVYAWRQHRRVAARDGEAQFDIEDYAVARWRATGQGDPPATFTTASELAPEAHLAMQAALQPWVDNAIAKTVNLPEGIDLGRAQRLFEQADALGLKGLTVYRPNPLRGQVLEALPPSG